MASIRRLLRRYHDIPPLGVDSLLRLTRWTVIMYFSYCPLRDLSEISRGEAGEGGNKGRVTTF